jgi:hypothetical protein
MIFAKISMFGGKCETFRESKISPKCKKGVFVSTRKVKENRSGAKSFERVV